MDGIGAKLTLLVVCYTHKKVFINIQMDVECNSYTFYATKGFIVCTNMLGTE